MIIHFLFLWALVLSSGSSATAMDSSESCKTTEELNDLCGTHTFQSVKPILNYVDQLQRELLSYEEERREVNKLRAKVQELEVKLAEGKVNENLILSKDTHIKDLQTTISVLQNSNNLLQQNVESVNAEIDKLKSFIKEELARELSKINSNASKLRNYEEQLKSNNKTISEYAAQVKSKETTLKTCQLNLKETQSVVSGYKYQLENTKNTIAEIKKQVASKEKTLKETQAKLKESQDQLKKQKQVNVEMEAKETELNEQIRKLKEIPTSCTSFGDSNVHNIKIPESFPVLCNSEIAGPGWTVIQQRIDGGEDFYRNWEDYKNGFGQMSGDFFVGLEKIHRLTNEKPHELYIHMEAFKGGHYKNSSFYARYDNFRIAGEADKYRLLSLGSFSGNAGEDRMRHHEHVQFSTFDSDNDKWSFGNCAIDRHAGWWYNLCSSCNLNGIYYQEEDGDCSSNWWYSCQSLKTIKMLIRPRGN